jgi:hypothetical protein
MFTFSDLWVVALGLFILSRFAVRPSRPAAPSRYGLLGDAVFRAQVQLRREEGEIESAAKLALEQVSKPIWASDRNLAIDILVSAGSYREALAAGSTPHVAYDNEHELTNLCLIQINLAETEYNLGRWDEAETDCVRSTKIARGNRSRSAAFWCSGRGSRRIAAEPKRQSSSAPRSTTNGSLLTIARSILLRSRSLSRGGKAGRSRGGAHSR